MKSARNIRYRIKKQPFVVQRVGYLSRKPDSSLSIEKFNEIPELVANAFGAPENARILDCRGRRDHLMSYEEISREKAMHTCLFFSLICQKDYRVSLLVFASGSTRIWIDGELFSVSSAMASAPFTVTLAKGTHVLCFENLHAGEDDFLSIRVGDLDREEAHPEASVYLSPLVPEEGECFLRQNDIVFSWDGVYRFMMVPHDTLQIPGDTCFSLTVRDTTCGKTVKRKRCRPLTQYTLVLGELPLDSSVPFHRLELRFRYRLKDGTAHGKSWYIFVGDADGFCEETINLAQRSLETSGDLTGEERCAMESLSGTVRARRNDWFQDVFTLREIADRAGDGSYTASLTAPGVRKVYFRSALDHSVIHYQIRVPKGYRPGKKYGLILIFSIEQYSEYSGLYRENHPEFDDYLCADVTCRGITLGSYIGEASIREILSEICRRYSVDRTRIYGVGHSSGAAACIVTAGNYPGLFAGIYPCGGYFDTRILKNLANTPAVFVYADSEIFSDEDKYRFYRALGRDHKKARVITARGIIHSQLSAMQQNTVNLDHLIEKTGNPYPERIRFFTEHNRHLTSYWLRLEGISRGYSHAEAEATATRDGIRITLSGADGITVTLPPFVRRSDFYIRINGQVFSYRNTEENRYSFRKQGTRFAPADISEFRYPIYKGLGILDVYLSSMRIVCRKNNPALLSSAQAFAHPTGYGYQPKIFVDYPIEDLPDDEEAIPLNGSLIVLDQRGSNAGDTRFLSKIRTLAEVKTSADGYTYRGRTYNGAYCVAQILPNPRDPEGSILYISCNSPDALKKNYFLRRIILPTYTYGLHPYYRHAALISLNGHYYGIGEYGDEQKALVPTGH